MSLKYLIYKDGSSENTNVYYDDLLDRLEMIVYDFSGEWDLQITYYYTDSWCNQSQ